MGLFKKKEPIEEKREDVSGEDLLLTALMRGISVDREMAMSIPVVSGYVDLICNTFAMIPFKLYRETVEDGKKKTEEIADKRVGIINDDTTDTLDGFQFKKAMCEDYLLGRGGYAYIKKIGNEVAGLFYVKDANVSVHKNADPIYKSFDIHVGGKKYYLTTDGKDADFYSKIYAYFTYDANGNKIAVDAVAGAEIVSAVSSATLGNVHGYKLDKETLEKYGLSDTKYAVIKVNYNKKVKTDNSQNSASVTTKES